MNAEQPRVRKIAPQLGPQTVFSATPADIAFYGGSAGSGKTWALAYEAARYATVPGYSAVIFRRTSPELQGGGSIWEEARGLYPHLGGVPREHRLDWTFPSGATVEFRHAQYTHDVHRYQSKQWSGLFFDELTHFDHYQFWYLLSRVRGRARIPRRVRASTNPDPDSWVREFIDWWIGKDGLAIDERSGVLRWFVRLDERIVWGATPDEVVQQDPLRIRRRSERPAGAHDTRPAPMSFTFVRARVTDNVALLESDPGYVARLNLLPGAQAKRLRDGDWNARDGAGDYFDRSWCRIVDHVDERNVVRRVRFWDKAATSPSSNSPDPDWTRGVRVALLDDGRYVVEDLASLRAGPAEVDRLMRRTAETDGIACEVGAWQDPGQAGVVDREHMRDVLLGFSFSTIKAVHDKTTYANVWSPLAKSGRVWFLQREYLPELFAELEGFPRRKHDDIMDALSGAFSMLTSGAFSVDYQASPDPRHPELYRRLDEDDDDDEDDELPRVASARRGVF